MPLLLNFPWIKLPRNTLPPGKGIMGSWAHLATRAAFRPGQADYCGYHNDVELASWVGGIVGLKSILGIGNRQKAMEVMDKLSALGYISYTLDKATKKLSYTITDWVVECSGVACADGAIYATDGYGFLCLPRNITQRLAHTQYKFEESDAWLDLWCHTVWQDFRNALSYNAPIIQFGCDGAALTLEKLGARWGWEKTKVWRFLQKHGDVFPLRKLPGSYGCLVFNTQYPGADATVPTDREIARVLDRIRVLGQNMRFGGSDNQKLNRMILLTVIPASADTGESTLQISGEPARLIIQLGPGWAGTQFELRTDAGMYPGTVVVSDTGLLQMDLGGSKTFTLSRVQGTAPGSTTTAPTISSGSPAADTPTSAAGTVSATEAATDDVDLDAFLAALTEPGTEVPTEQPVTQEEQTPEGVPIKYILILGGGIVAAVIALVVLASLKKRRVDDDEEEDYED